MTERASRTTVEILLNGERRSVDHETHVADLVDHGWGRGVAVARNGEVVPRAAWETTPVEHGDEIEIVHPIQGGCI